MSKEYYHSTEHIFTTRSERENIELTAGDNRTLDITRTNLMTDGNNTVKFNSASSEIQIIDSSDQSIMRIGKNDYNSSINTVSIGNGITRADRLGQTQGTLLKLECPAPTNHISCITPGAFQTNVKFIAGAAIVGTITTGAFGTAYNTSSDAILKEDLKPVKTLDNYINKIDVFDYRLKSDKSRAIGCIAQNLNEVYPCCVSTTEDILMVDHSRLVPLLIQGMKELNEKVVSLELDLKLLKMKLIN